MFLPWPMPSNVIYIRVSIFFASLSKFYGNTFRPTWFKCCQLIVWKSSQKLPIPLSASWQKWGKVGIEDSPLLPPHPRSLSPRPASMQCSFFSTIININLERSPPPSPFATIARSNQTLTIAVRRTKPELGEHNDFFKEYFLQKSWGCTLSPTFRHCA